jgi:hypothetical protein
MAVRAGLLGVALGPFAVALAQVETVPGMPPVVDAKNLYSEIGPDRLSSAVAGHRELV